MLIVLDRSANREAGASVQMRSMHGRYSKEKNIMLNDRRFASRIISL